MPRAEKTLLRQLTHIIGEYEIENMTSFIPHADAGTLSILRSRVGVSISPMKQCLIMMLIILLIVLIIVLIIYLLYAMQWPQHFPLLYFQGVTCGS